MIIKIQAPLIGAEWLIYNKDKSIMVQFGREAISLQVRQIVFHKGGKAYFEASIKNKKLDVSDLVEEQEW